MWPLFRFVSQPYLQQHRWRVLFPLLGIALGVAVFVAVRVTNVSTLRAFARTVDAIAGRAGLEIVGRGAPLDEALLPLARRAPGVASVAPLVLADVLVQEARGATMLVAGIDVVADREVRDYTFRWTAGDQHDPFAMLTQPQSIVLSERFAQRHGLAARRHRYISIHHKAPRPSPCGACCARKGPLQPSVGTLRSWISLLPRCCSSV